MHINLITLFPEYFDSPLSCALMLKARENNLIRFNLFNPRDQAIDKHRTVDDSPYGGGPGMVMSLAPLVETLKRIPNPGRILLMTPAGQPLDQTMARELAAELTSGTPLTLVSGRYEGIDARLLNLFPITPVSVGDYVLNGGETACLNVIESVCRLLPGFMGHEDSGQEESFTQSLLEYPHYTRPETFDGHSVPQVLTRGDHARIAEWRREQSLRLTLEQRPELLDSAPLTASDLTCLQGLSRLSLGRNLHLALVHYPVLDKDKNSLAVSLTNLDIHDIARSSCCYGLGGYYIVTPLQDQQHLLAELLEHWTVGAGSRSNPDRAKALNLVTAADSVSDVLALVEKRCGEPPLVLGSSARPQGSLTYAAVREALAQRPVLLLLGTGHGLAPAVLDKCDDTLRPLCGASAYNHFSVRSAAAIVLDRILGDWY
jgi:tRNA (guanine37-N1)-methyltransferase